MQRSLYHFSIFLLFFTFTSLSLHSDGLTAFFHNKKVGAEQKKQSSVEKGPPPYNLPISFARSKLECKKNSFFVTGAYTYWYAGEEGLDIARSGNFIAGDDPYFISSNTVLSQPFEYRSGFKVIGGWRKNNWILSAGYIWVANSTHQNSTINPASLDLTTNTWVVAPWFIQQASDGGSLSGTNVISKWRLTMNIADFLLSHPCGVGARLAITPFGGLRAAWICQKMDLTLTETFGIFPNLAPQPISSYNGSKSWAIGPKFGAEVNVLLGCGFKVVGAGSLSLLYTEYTTVYHNEQLASPDAYPTSNVTAVNKNQQTIRPAVECGLGFAWGKYLFKQNCYFNLSATYDFMYWWNQNMMRQMLSQLWNRTSCNGDLYLHGLTLAASLSF